MVYKIDKIKDNVYKLNDSVTVEFNENSDKEFLKADYDENILTEEVNNIIDTFIKMIGRELQISDSLKVSDGSSK
jgi:hypothetical protein